MLQNIREKSQGWVMWVIVTVICATFALWGIHNYAGSGEASSVVAKVNGKAITNQQLNQAFQRYRRQQQTQLGANYIANQQTQTLWRKQVLQQLINNIVISQSTMKNGYNVSPLQVDSALQSIQAFQVNGQFSKQRFLQLVNNMMFTPQQFLNEIRNDLLINQLRAGIGFSAFTLPSEVGNAIKLVDQKRDIALIKLPLSDFMRKVKISNASAQEFYTKNKSKFITKSKVSVDYIELNAAKLAKKITISDKQLQNYYKQNQGNFTIPAKWEVAHILLTVPKKAKQEDINKIKTKAQSIAAQLAKGAKFSVLAKKYSQDLASSKKGGDIGWIEAGSVGPQFEKTLEGLKPGQISQPVQTKYGFNIIKLIAVKAEKLKPFDQVKSQILKNMQNQQAMQRFANDSEVIANLTFENPNSLKKAADKLGLKIQTTDLFTKEGLKQGIAKNKKIINAAFSSDVLTQKNNSQPINITDNDVVVLRINKSLPSKTKPFDSVKAEIVKHLQKLAAEKQAMEVAINIKKAILSGKAVNSVARSFGYSAKIKNNMSRSETTIDSAVVKRAFELPTPKKNVPVVDTVSLPNGNVAVIDVLAVHAGKLQKTDTVSREAFKDQMALNYGQMDYALYVKSQLASAKVEYPEK